MKAKWQKRTTELPETLEIKAETADDVKELRNLAEQFGCTQPVNASSVDDDQTYLKMLEARLKVLEDAKIDSMEGE